MGKKCYDNAFSFNLFIYDLDNNVYEYFTNQKFSGVNMKEAVSNAIQWIEKSFSHFDSLDYRKYECEKQMPFLSKWHYH